MLKIRILLILIAFSFVASLAVASVAATPEVQATLCDAGLSLRVGSTDFQIERLNPELFTFLVNALRHSEASKRASPIPADLTEAQAMSQQQELIQQYRSQIAKLKNDLSKMGIFQEAVEALITSAEEMREIGVLLANPSNAFAATSSGLMILEKGSDPALSEYENLVKNAREILRQDSSFNFDVEMDHFSDMMATLKGSSEKRTEDLISSSIHRIQYILVNQTSRESALRLAKKELGRLFLKVEKAYVTVINSRRTLWQLEQQADSQAGVQPLTLRVAILRLKNRIAINLETLGRNYPQYRAARLYLQKAARPESVECSTPACSEVAQMLLDTLGITPVESNRRSALLVGAKPSLEDIEYMYNYNPEAYGAQFFKAATLGVWDTLVRTPAYIFSNLWFVNNLLNKLPEGRPREYLKYAWHTAENARSINNHFKPLSDVLEFSTIDDRFEKLVSANGTFPGIMQTASRLLGFPWDELKNYCETMSKGQVKAEMYQAFLEKMKEEQVKGREYGLLSPNAKVPWVQMATAYMIFEMTHHKVMGEYFAIDNFDRLQHGLRVEMIHAYYGAVDSTSNFIGLLAGMF